jgi:hypothetical protein
MDRTPTNPSANRDPSALASTEMIISKTAGNLSANTLAKDDAVTRSPEVLFVDPAVDDLATILGNLRPEVEAIVLDRVRPAARQIATALEDRQGLGAVHVIAHGAPGRVSFAAGEWSLARLWRDAADLASIGPALADGGELRLWACETGRGAAGEAFVLALAEAAGAEVAAASGRVGAGALGATWALSGRGPAARPPLTETGAARYAGILATSELVVTGRLPEGETTKSITYFILDTSRNTIVGQVILPDTARGNISVSVTVKVPISLGPFAIGAFDEQGNFVPTAFLSVNSPAGGQTPGGAVGR